MSDDGSANFTPPCCEYPVPHSGVGSFGEAETVSISARTDDFSDVFDWDLYYARRKSTTDVTSPSSNVPSEGRPAAGISSHQEDSPMPDVAPHDPKPPHVWPRVPDPQPPRDLEVQLESSPSPSPATEMRVGGYAHIPSGPDQKRTRVVVNPGKTNEVRQAGSCYYCKMSKTGCDASSVCGPCSKRPLGELACIRKPLKDINTSVMTRWNWNEPNATIPSRGQLDERRPYPIFISVSERIESPCLEVEVCPYTLPSHQEHGEAGIRRFGIRWDERRSEAMIYHWMEEQILAEKSTDFETQMDKLLCCFVRRLERGAPPEGEHISMLHQTAQITETLLSKILKMRCMWKVWSCKQFFVRKHPGARWQPISPFDSSFASVQASLRQLAAEAISQLERQILSELAAYIAKGPARDVRKWLLLWQLILLYRQSLRWMLEQQLSEQQRTNAAPIAIGAMPVNEKRHIFRETTMRLLNAITVLYSGKFTKQTTVKAIRDAKAEACGDDRQLHLMFQTAWQALGEFYQQVLRQVSPTDDLFKACIVEKELGILEMGRPARN